MANTVIGASVEIQYQSVGEMRKALREANSELIAMTEKFGLASKEAQAAGQKVANLKDAIGDAKAFADTFNPDKKFVALSGAVQGVVSGFSALQGAMGLFGSESKEVEKLLLKVQSAMALQQGISGIFESIDSFKLLGARIAKNTIFLKAFSVSGNLAAGAMRVFGIAVNTTSTAFKVLRGVILSLGIGALVVALGYVVEKVMDWANSTKQTENNINALKKANDRLNSSLDNQISILEAIGGKEREIFALRQQQATNELNTLRKTYAERSKEGGKFTEEEAKRFEELKTQIRVNEIKENNRIRDEQKKHNDELAAKNKKYASAQLKEQKQHNAEADKLRQENQEKEKSAIDALEEVNNELKKRRLNAQEVELFDLRKQYEEKKKVIEAGGKSSTSLTELYEKQKADIEKKYQKIKQDEELKYRDLVNELIARNQDGAILTEQEKAVKAIQDKYAKERDELMKQYPNNLQLMILLKQNEKKELDALEDKFKQEKLQKDAADALTESANEKLTYQQRIDKIILREQLLNQIIFKNEDERTAYIKANSQARQKIEEDELKNKLDVETAKYQAASQSLGALSNLIGVFADKNEKDNKKIFEVQKALNISQAIVDTYSAANAIMKNAAINPTSILFPAQPFISAGVAIATGLANVVKISQQRYKSNASGGGGTKLTPPALGGTTAPMIPQLGATATAQALNAQAINNLGNTALRAYVTNSDIQNTQQQNAYLQRNARLG